jgi:iron complex outermembrane receptor protein
MSRLAIWLSRLANLICIATLVVLSAQAATGFRIHGRITDQSGAIVASASVSLLSREGSKWSSTSDSKGSYEFAGLIAGDYLLQVRMPGFRTQVTTLSLRGGDDREFDVALRVAGIDDEVVITASGTTQSVEEASKSITIVDNKDLERRDAGSLIDALRDVPGVRVEQLGGPGSFSKIFVRGLRVVDTSLLIDGIRVRDASDFRGSINPYVGDLLVNNVDRIEVLRGSGSSLYGSNAVGGVVNLIPADGTGHPRFDLGLEGGSLGTLREQARVTGGAGRGFGYSFSGTRLDVSDGVHGNEVYRNTSAGGHAHYNINQNMTIRGTFTLAHGFGRLTDSPFPIGPAGNEFGFASGSGPVSGFIDNEVNPDSFRFATLLAGSAAFSHQVNSTYNYSVYFQSVSTRSLFSNGPDQSEIAKRLGVFEFAGDTHLDGRIDTLNWTNNILVGRHNLVRGGLEWERESFSQEFSSPTFATPRTTDRQSSLAIFGQDQLSWFEGRLQVLAAVRSQGFAINNPESVPAIHDIPIKRSLTGDGSIAYTIGSSGTRLRSHVGNSFRAPSLSERFTIFNGMRIGNPFLRPERGLSVDGGLDQRLFRDRIRFSGTYFYSRLQELITSTSGLQEINARGALSRGLELSLEASPTTGLDLRAAYTYANSAQILPASTLRFDNVVLAAGTSVASFSIPRHSFSFEANQTLRRGLNLNVDVYSVSKHTFPLFDPVFFSQVLFDFSGYTRAGLGASYTKSVGEKRQITFSARFNNIADVTIFEEGFRTPGHTATAGIKFHF